MKKILIFALNLLVCLGDAGAAVRDGTAVSRTKTNKAVQSRTSTTERRQTTSRGTTLTPQTTVTRSATTARDNGARKSRPGTIATRTATPRNNSGTIAARATQTTTTMSSTRTGTEYEQCKNTYFSCMDQFCMLKNDDYRRCSCNDRVFNLAQQRNVLQDAGNQLTVFTENLDAVGMTAAQAAAMRTESEGEAALGDDKSASKALLQAIMNSIRGDSGSVSGKYSDLNSINITFDTVNAFGMTDVGQAIAAYNGNALYSAVYPQCRNAVRNDCNDASLQRAITAYLMAIEQDCNTVQTAIEQTQRQMKGAIREGSAMLDLARIENRQNHNSSDITTCINDVESAILSEQVCGANYHKCLDNGEFIDITTGKPITGVENFYELETLLTFSDGVEAANQKLSKNPSNRTFVQNFESRVKPFAQDALNKCVENSDIVWSEYLDQAMLDIYYAQKSKVTEIKQGCFDYISACYMNGDTAITAAMAELTDIGKLNMQPSKIELNTKMCTDYVNSCNNMFDNNIIADYIQTVTNTDMLTACRAVVKQCFDNYGGTNYENFYYPYSGLFSKLDRAPDWFTLYEITGMDDDGTPKYELDSNGQPVYKSECAKQLQTIPACNNPEMIEDAFGGFDLAKTLTKDTDGIFKLMATQSDNASEIKYGLLDDDIKTAEETKFKQFKHRYLRSTGVATEVYNQIISILSTQCMNLNGRFIEPQFIANDIYKDDNYCLSNFANSKYDTLTEIYGIGPGENMCPRDYGLGVAIQSWGACLCWENGARRSKWGKSVSCVSVLPELNSNGAECTAQQQQQQQQQSNISYTEDDWCTATTNNQNQVIPPNDKDTYDNLPKSIN